MRATSECMNGCSLHHTRTHTCTHARMHAHTLAHMHSRTHTCTHARTHACTHAHTHARTRTHLHACTHGRMHPFKVSRLNKPTAPTLQVDIRGARFPAPRKRPELGDSQRGPVSLQGKSVGWLPQVGSGAGAHPSLLSDSTGATCLWRPPRAVGCHVDALRSTSGQAPLLPDPVPSAARLGATSPPPTCEGLLVPLPRPLTRMEQDLTTSLCPGDMEGKEKPKGFRATQEGQEVFLIFLLTFSSKPKG